MGSSYATYKVTNNAKAAVTYVKPGKKTLAFAAVPKSVRINGKTYKVTAVASKAFNGCKKLSKVAVSSNVKTIGSKAFVGCKKLKTVSCTSASLKSVGSQAFQKCSKLKTVSLSKTTKLTKKGVKGSLKGSSVKTMKVKASKVKAYKKYFKKANCGRKVSAKKA